MLRLMRTVGVTVVAAAFLVAGCGPGSTGATKTITSYVTAEPPSTHATSASVPQAVPAPMPAPTPAGPKDSISSDGTYVIGVDIQPGVYRSAGTASEGSTCYWKRLSSLNTSDIIDNNDSSGPQTVEIKSTDKAFVTERCQPWTKVG